MIVFNNNCNAKDEITIFTNATKVQVGHPFTMRCKVTDLTENLLQFTPIKIEFRTNARGFFAQFEMPSTFFNFLKLLVF